MVVITMEARMLQSSSSPYSGSRARFSAKRLPRTRKESAGLALNLRKTPRLRVALIQAKLAGKPSVPLEEQLSNGEELAKWQAARAPLLGFSVSEQEANQILAKSFGWSPSPYWGEERTKTMPDPELVQKTLDFLCSLGLLEADVPVFLKKFPEVLGCLVEEEMQKNVQILEKEWGISGGTLRNLLLRNPKVLGYNVDCKGDCMAQCTRCWVRF